MNQDRSGGAAQLSPEKKRLLLQQLLRERKASEDLDRIPRRSPSGPVPMSFAQQRLWVVDRLEPESAAYNMPVALRMRGPLDVPALRAALDELVRRHEVLRTTLSEHEGTPVQVVHPPAPVALREHDLAGLPEAEREAAARGLVSDEALRPFDLQAGPLLRSALIRLGDEDHVLCFTLHHVVSDGWSMDVLVREVSAMYAAFTRGEEPGLPELPVQYADYAVWQRDRLSGRFLEEQVGYWKTALQGAPALLEIPTDRARAAGRSARAGKLTFAFPAEVAAGLRALTRREGATSFMTLLAAWQVLLGRWAGQDDVVVGTPVAGRTRVELEGLIGFFVNMLALRTRLGGDPTWTELLRRVRDGATGAYDHQELPFERLVEELVTERSLTHSPVFQVIFEQRKSGGPGRLGLGGLALERLGGDEPAAKFDLDLAVFDDDEELSATLLYSTDLFDAETAERMAGHLRTLAGAMAADPSRPVAEASLLSAGERAQVVEEWNLTARPYPREATLHGLFAAQVERAPDALAVSWGGEELSYRELDARANRLAHHLAGLGVGPEERVGVLLERSLETVVATLAVMKAGGCCVPVDASYPPERMRLMLEDSAVRVLLSRGDLAEPLADAGLRVLRLDRAADAVAAEPEHAPPGGAASGSLAYVFYTSGSTGRPKGVMMEHGQVVQFAACVPDTMPLGPGDRVGQASNQSFDAAVFEIWGALLNGATLVGIDRDVLLSARLLGAALREGGITHLYQTAALFHQHVREQVDVYACLRQLVFGAEAVGTEGVRRMLARGRPGRVLHEYGPTEATVWCTLDLVEQVEAGAATVPIGRPIPNARAYVLDAGMEPVPVGLEGELCVGGEGVVRGYLGRPELTAEKFVPDPFGGAGARMYRTGDRTRWKTDGRLEFLGRVDEQVKLRGFRIEMGEVESAIAACPGVRQARAVVREDEPGDKRLVAYVVPREGEEVSAAGLRDHLSTRLPGYMMPSAFVVLEKLPLNANGKVDRRALPAPEREAGAEYAPPRTPTEELLAGIWAEVLHVERVGVRESFFSLGGHSLLATQVVSRARLAFGVELPLRALFEAPTVAALAERVEELRSAGAGVAGPIEPTPREGPLPLSFAQQRLWFIDQMEPGSAAYNIPYALRLRGGFDPAVLERSLTEIVRRHETLRTVFAAVDGEPVQVVLDAAPVALPVTELRDLPADQREAEVLRLAREEAARPFDLAAGPLLRVEVARLDEAEWAVLFTMHHVVGDEWSTGVLIREVSELYDALSAGREPALPELPVQYADYAAWQRARLTGEALEARLDYWRDRLAGAPALLELPTDRPRPQSPDPRGAVVGFRLPAEVAAGVRALARREGATAFMTLAAAWQLLLSRWSGQDDVSVGTPIAGRTRLELEPLIGFFVNTLVLRTELSGGPSFRELLGRVREATLGAYQHQEIPFERLVEELAPERSLAHSPLFQAMFVLQNDEQRGGLRMGGLQVEPLGAGGAGIAKFDLTLRLAEDEQGMVGALAYRTALWDEATMERMAGHFARLVGAVVADAARPVSDVGFLGEEERAQLLAEWSGAAAVRPVGDLVHGLFAAQAARAPDAPAVSFGGATTTYRELDAASSRLANYLRRRGVGPEIRVALCTERSAEAIVGILAILKAGGCYVPLDPQYPADRLAFMLADAGAPVLLTQERLLERLPEHGAQVVCLDTDAEEIGRESAEAPEVELTPEHLCYLIYTSGSTGTPKGVAVPHRAVVRLVRDTEFIRFGPDEVFLQLAPVSFDAATLEIWGPLLNGGRLAVPAPGAPTVKELGAVLEREGVTTLWLTAGLFHLVMDEDPQALRGVRQLLAGGDVLSAAHVARALAELPDTRLVNGYGPTENTTFTCCHAVAPADVAAGSIPIGAPIAGTRVYVLDASGEPAPAGVPGELYAGGAGVARGYLGRPELTAEKFVPDPFSAEPGARLYRTGDRVRWRRDGVVEFLGRMDTQLKLRGFRVEPGEVEAALLAHASVGDAVAVAREDVPGELRLVAYVVPAGGEASAAELREHLRARLPEHMVPAAVVVLAALPLTANGKVDRRALPAPEYEGAEESYVAPRTPAEEVLAGIYADVLRVGTVGSADDFFALGGHSLLATRAVSRVRQAFGVDLPLRALFEAPTVAELAERVEALRRAELPVLPPIVPGGRGDAVPLSFAQERLWFLDRLQPGGSTYNMATALRLGGALDLVVMERALGEIVRRHETLRTVFAEVDGSPVQVIAPFGGFSLPVDDLSALAEEEHEAEVARAATLEAARPFDLAAGPLFHARVLRLGAEDHVLLLSMHHIVSDAWSMEVLAREFAALYAAFSRGEPSPLPELPVQYADYAAWQRAHLQGEALARQLSYWRERLAGAPALLELPTDRPRPQVQSHAGAYERADFPADLLDRLRTLGRREGATLYMVVLGAFQVLLAKYAGSEDVVVGSPIAGRTRRETEELIGFFVNTLVLRTDLAGDPSFREVLGRVREGTLGAYEHQEIPFERLVAELQPERSMGHSPLFQVMFSLNEPGVSGAAAGLSELRLSGVAAEVDAVKFDLNLNLTEHPGGLAASVGYRTDLFDRATIRRMLAHLGRVLEQVAAAPDLRLAELELLGGEERRAVVEEWNATAAEYPRDACIHQLFAAQALRTPDAVAACCEGNELSYAELDRRANRLAHHLAERGVGPDARVGICAERSPETVVGLLAVLKAGGAYVPLDPAYPADRLRFMLEDAAPAVLLTHGVARSLVDGLVEGAAVPVIDLAADAGAWAECPETDPQPAGLGPESLAYVIYTSGSTGRPKGVMNQHRAVVNRLVWGALAWEMGADESVLLKTSLNFDGSLREIFLPLIVGARVVVARPDGHRDPEYLLDVVRREGIGTVNLVPSMLQVLLEQPGVAASFAGLRRVLCGGEALPGALLERFRERLPHVALHNLYGPSEAATALTALHCTEEPAGATVPIGRPTANVRVYVLDGAGRPLPARIPGELFIGGAGVARGYAGRPDLTAERFVPDPFGAEPGARLYRTGDLARWLADGRLEFLGRNDFQVKVRGFRIELGEVEARLAEHPEVAGAAVAARDDAAGSPFLVAYYVAPEGLGAEALRAHLAERLPEYMVPAAYVRLERLPLTPSGKLDRKALPAPTGEAYASRAYHAPAGEVQVALAAIWAEVLKTERVGAHDGFFALGGHSLLATRVVSRVRQALGVELPLRALFEGPTVAELAERVEALRRAGQPLLPPVVPVERSGALPLSFAQERLWFLDQLQPGSSSFNIPVALRLRGALDAAALEAALGEIVRRHEALRTVFAEAGGRPVQVVLPFEGFALPVESSFAATQAERDAAARRRAGEEAARPFDLAAGPLFRASLLRLAEDDHVLMLAMHHVVSDGWSMGVLFRELSALYAAFAAGEPSPLAELPVQYPDFAAWQREQLRGDALERQVEWWKERLLGAPELLEIPTDHPRPGVMSFRGATEPIHLPVETLERLEALARREGATLFMVLLGAFQSLLARYAEVEDVVVGSTIAGRTRAETEGLIGLFMNTLVLRADLSGDPSHREVVGRVRGATLGAYEHQEVPFERLVEELAPERSLGHTPVFQVLFELYNMEAEGGAVGLPGLEVGRVQAELGTVKTDLSVSMRETPHGLVGGLSYATDLFDPGTARRMVEQLGRVLEQVSRDPEVRLSELTLIGDEERRQVVEEWNDNAAEFPAAHCIHQLFEAQAARTPEAVAVVFGGEELSYRELDGRANQLAHHLRGLGVGPEVRVGLCLERSLEMMVGIMGVMKAGGAYVPVDPAHPAERIGYVMEDSGVSLVVTQERLRERLPDLPALCLDTEWEGISAEPATAPGSGVTAENLCYVIYTSGSTGRPKGVAMHHRGVCNYIDWGVRFYGADTGSGAPVFSSMAVDLTITNLLPLFAGLPVRMLPEENAVEALADELRGRPGFGLVKITPTHLTLLSPLLTPEEARAAAATLVIGADFLSAETTLFWQDNAPEVRLMNEYGPTETVVGCSAYLLPPGRHRAGAVPVGRAIQNLTFYVLDAHLEPVPVGLPGELYIGGVGVARGYLGRPALSAEKFVPDAFDGGAGARMYRTGDRARWTPDGSLLILGRRDNQVKVRGYRVELGEIEAALRRHEHVTGCLVVIREDVPGDRRVVAYVVGDAGADELREHLRRMVPEYMVPSAFVRLESLPQTRTGKIDPKTLPAPEYEGAEESYVAPRTPAEEVLAGIWAEVLRLERVGVHDNFFALGGHSLLAVTLVERMRKRGMHADVRALFTTPTVAELAAAVAGDTGGFVVPPNRIPAGAETITPEMLPLVELTQAEIDRVLEGVPGGAMNVQDVYPLAPIQEGILLHYLLGGEGDPYLVSLPFSFESREALDGFLYALQSTIDRHDILRTSVAWEGLPEPVQVVWRMADLRVEEVETDPAAGDPLRQLHDRFDLGHRMDLRRAPMMRGYVSRAAGEGWVLLLQFHHLVSDHTTMEALQFEVDAHVGGRAAELPAVQPFRNLVAQARLGVSRAEHEAFFREMLADVDEPTAPFGLGDVHGNGAELEQARLPVDEWLGDRLRAQARALGVSPASVYHVAWAQVLARVSGRRDVVFGTLLLGRMQGGEGADRVMGPFINVLPVRIRVEDEGAQESVRRAQALLAGLVKHEHASLALAQGCSGVQGPQPLFTSLFNYRHTHLGGSGDGTGARDQGIQNVERSNFPLSFTVDDLGDRFLLTAQVEAAVGPARVCALMHAALEGLVGALEVAPEMPVGEIEVLPEAERRREVEEWNRTGREHSDPAAHELFARWARRAPDAPALLGAGGTVTYAELDRRADVLARRLREVGVGPETPVGLCAEPTPELLAGVLGIWKAGGAYVPLDPALPAARLGWILADAGAPVVVTAGCATDALPEHGATVVDVNGSEEYEVRSALHTVGQPDDGSSSGDGVSSRTPYSVLRTSSLAYVIYTSGSTGRPKGVLVEHGSLSGLLAATRAEFGVGAGDVMPALASSAFDIWLFEALLPLTSGGAVRLVERERVPDVPALLDEIADVTLLHAVPALMRRIVGEEGERPRLGRLRRAFTGGDRVPPELLGQMREALPGAEAHVLYGPTEATVLASAHPVPEHGAVAGHPLGRPLANVRLYVCDERGSPQPAGVAGELLVGGTGVARGYLGRADLTAAAFVPDPFGGEPGARLYRTGDLARRAPDGTLEFLGRMDRQVKVRGFRVEPGEVEARLAALDGVGEAAVVAARGGEAEDARLVAYVVPRDGAGLDPDALRRGLRRDLPEHMVPDAFLELDWLPLLPSGKVDVRALPAPEAAARGYVEPRTALERTVAESWAAVLGVEGVGLHDSFFELGGHSLAATRVMSRLRELGVEVPLRAFFEAPTVEALARAVQGAQAGRGRTEPALGALQGHAG